MRIATSAEVSLCCGVRIVGTAASYADPLSPWERGVSAGDHFHQPPFDRREDRPELMAAPQHLAGLADQRPGAVARGRAFLDPVFGPLGGAAERPEGGGVGPQLDRIILPQSGGDHAAVEVDDAVQFSPRETGLN